MKKNLFALSFLAVALTWVGCNGGSSAVPKNATPSEAAVAIWKLVQDGSYMEAVKLSERCRNISEEEMEQLAALAEAVFASVGGVKDVEVLDETLSEDGQSATVILQLTYGNGDTEIQKEKMVMTEDGWRPAQ